MSRIPQGEFPRPLPDPDTKQWIVEYTGLHRGAVRWHRPNGQFEYWVSAGPGQRFLYVAEEDLRLFRGRHDFAVHEEGHIDPVQRAVDARLEEALLPLQRELESLRAGQRIEAAKPGARRGGRPRRSVPELQRMNHFRNHEIRPRPWAEIAADCLGDDLRTPAKAAAAAVTRFLRDTPKLAAEKACPDCPRGNRTIDQ